MGGSSEVSLGNLQKPTTTWNILKYLIIFHRIASSQIILYLIPTSQATLFLYHFFSVTCEFFSLSQYQHPVVFFPFLHENSPRRKVDFESLQSVLTLAQYIDQCKSFLIYHLLDSSTNFFLPEVKYCEHTGRYWN